MSWIFLLRKEQEDRAHMCKDNLADNNQELLYMETSGFSMRPFIKGKERIIVKKSGLKCFRIGDAVVFKKNGKLICHRLIKKVKLEGRYIIFCRGDNSYSAEMVTEDAVEGRVAAIIKDNKVINFDSPVQHAVNFTIVLISPWLIKVLRNLKSLLYNNRCLKKT